MSFKPCEKQNLIELLSVSNKYKLRPYPNIVKTLTIGYQSLIISTTEALNSLCKRESIATENELLDLHSLKNISSRYKYIRLIQYGSFSQVLECVDRFTSSKVAIKVMKKDFHTMGIRECLILRHLSSYQTSSSCFCKIFTSYIIVIIVNFIFSTFYSFDNYGYLPISKTLLYNSKLYGRNFI
jgi:hypothetical protein